MIVVLMTPQVWMILLLLTGQMLLLVLMSLMLPQTLTQVLVVAMRQVALLTHLMLKPVMQEMLQRGMSPQGQSELFLMKKRVNGL
jgi:hypothetical protein